MAKSAKLKMLHLYYLIVSIIQQNVGKLIKIPFNICSIQQ